MPQVQTRAGAEKMTERPAERTTIEATGGDAVSFLQSLVTNDIEKCKSGLVYAALLTPQGKYLFDFFVRSSDDTILIDIDSKSSASFFQRLSMYKLRTNVSLNQSPCRVARGIDSAPDGAVVDPRHPMLGWRLYDSDVDDDCSIDWDRIRVDHCVPESGIELLSERTFILEAGFERLNGVDFRKGCFVGQEVTARMKHKAKLNKRLVTVEVEGCAPVGTPISAEGRPVGTLYTQSGGRGIAHLRLDRIQGRELIADSARIRFDQSEIEPNL